MRFVALTLAVLAFAAVARSEAGDQRKPEWRDAPNRVTVFGEVQRPGFYGLFDKPVSLHEILIAAGMPAAGKDFLVILHRPAEGGAKVMLVEGTRLKEDGTIPLRANDVVEVTTDNRDHWKE